jgi:hypothetical protein
MGTEQQVLVAAPERVPAAPRARVPGDQRVLEQALAVRPEPELEQVPELEQAAAEQRGNRQRKEGTSY